MMNALPKGRKSEGMGGRFAEPARPRDAVNSKLELEQDSPSLNLQSTDTPGS